MKRFFRKVPILIVTLVLGCDHRSSIPVIGIDGQGRPSQIYVPQQEYSKALIETASSVNDSALPALGRETLKSEWIIRTVSIGISINTMIGIGPFKIGAAPRSRYVFSNSADPIIP